MHVQRTHPRLITIVYENLSKVCIPILTEMVKRCLLAEKRPLVYVVNTFRGRPPRSPRKTSSVHGKLRVCQSHSLSSVESRNENYSFLPRVRHPIRFCVHARRGKPAVWVGMPRSLKAHPSLSADRRASPPCTSRLPFSPLGIPGHSVALKSAGPSLLLSSFTLPDTAPRASFTLPDTAPRASL